MPIGVVRDELARMLGEASRMGKGINNERIRRRAVIADHAAGKAKAA